MTIRVLILMFLAGCATVEQEKAYMEAVAAANATPVPNYQPVVIRVPDPAAVCKLLKARVRMGGAAAACADPTGAMIKGKCAVIVGFDHPWWLEWHEELHCKYGDYHP